ncbi:MAG: DUF1847 domain-containing protein [Eubacteriales bacterium]
MDNFYGKVIGLSKEARAVNDIFENNGFKVYSVACKNGSRPREDGLDNPSLVIKRDLQEMKMTQRLLLTSGPHGRYSKYGPRGTLL